MTTQYIYTGSWSRSRKGDADYHGEPAGVGVYRLRYQEQTAKEAGIETASLEKVGVFDAEHRGQSILTIAEPYLIAACELPEDGYLVSYRMEPDGSLTPMDTLRLGVGFVSYCLASKNGKYVFASSMGNGSIWMVRIREDGTLGMKDTVRLTGHSVTLRQSCAKVHSVMLSPDGSRLVAANLGADELDVLEVDYERERLRLLFAVPVDWAKEPRHMAFSPDGKALYLITEHGNRLYDFRITGKGQLQELAAYQNLNPDLPPVGMAADIVVSPDGRTVYASNRGQNNIAVWHVLPSGLLDLAAFAESGGQGPRGLTLSKDGKLLLAANNTDGILAVLPVDPGTGIPGKPLAAIAAPDAACVRIHERDNKEA